MAEYKQFTPEEINLLLSKLNKASEPPDDLEDFFAPYDEEDLKELLVNLKGKKSAKEPFAGPGGKTGSLEPDIKKWTPPKVKRGAAASKTTAVVVKANDPTIPGPKTPTKKPGDPQLVLNVVPPLGFDLTEFIPNLTTDTDLQGFHPRPEYFNQIKLFADTGQNLLLIGEAGSGKSTIGKYFAMRMGWPFLAISADGLMGIKELFGLPSISGATSYFVEGLFTTFTQIGWKEVPNPKKKGETMLVEDPTMPGAVILIDEVTALDPSKNFVFHQILAERKFFVRDANKTYYVAPKVMIMFAGNPYDPRYEGTAKMNLAFADRLGTIRMEALTVDEIKIIIEKEYGNTLKQGDIDFLMDYVRDMRDFIKTGQDPLPAEMSMRSIKRMAAFLAKGVDRYLAVQLGFLNTYIAHDKETFDALSAHSLSIVGPP